MMIVAAMLLVLLGYIVFVGYIVKIPFNEIFRIDVPVLLLAAVFSILLSFVI